MTKLRQEEVVVEAVPPGQPLPDSGKEDSPAAPAPEATQMRCGYIIGVRENDEIAFGILGTHPSVAELLGLHMIAGERVQAKADKKLSGKFTLLATMLDEIMGMIKQQSEPLP